MKQAYVVAQTKAHKEGCVVHFESFSLHVCVRLDLLPTPPRKLCPTVTDH